MAAPEYVKDWVAYVRDCIHHPSNHPELSGDTWSVKAALSKLGDDLAATPYGSRFADAALTILENGTVEESRDVLAVSLDSAPDAAARIAAILRTWWSEGRDDEAYILIRRGLEVAANDPDLVAAIDDYAAIDPVHAARVIRAALPLQMDVVVRHLPALTREQDPSGQELLMIATRAPAADWPRILDAIAMAGPDFVTRFMAALRAPDAPAHIVEGLEPLLARFAAT